MCFGAEPCVGFLYQWQRDAVCFLYHWQKDAVCGEITTTSSRPSLLQQSPTLSSQYLAMVEAVQCVLHAPAALSVNFDQFKWNTRALLAELECPAFALWQPC